MLRWLMSWCVPDRALRFESSLEPGAAGRDASGSSLFVTLAAYGRGTSEPDASTSQATA